MKPTYGAILPLIKQGSQIVTNSNQYTTVPSVGCHAALLYHVSCNLLIRIQLVGYIPLKA